MRKLDQVIKSAKYDGYSELGEIQRIELAIKCQLSESLLPLQESGSEDMRTIAREVYNRFCEGYGNESHSEVPGSYL